MDISFAPLTEARRDCVVILVAAGEQDHAGLDELDGQLLGALRRGISASQFRGGAEDALMIYASRDALFDQLLLIGIGAGPWPPAAMVEVGARVAQNAMKYRARRLQLLARPLTNTADQECAAAQLLLGLRLGEYRFDSAKSSAPDQRDSIESAVIVCGELVEAADRGRRTAAVSEGVLLARDLVNTPANILTPLAFARRCEALRDLGIEVELLTRSDLEAIGMNALLSVSAGSGNPPAVVVMRWRGTGTDAPVVVVGKGVTFDSGGLCLKPRLNMERMKGDMAGAAAVTGLMHALASSGASSHVVGLIGLVENMPDGDATRPGDVVTSLSGLTIENVNTDAEGRVVLADLLSYAARQLNARTIIDMATLTGAVVSALGKGFGGIFSNDDELMGALQKAGEQSGERLWRLPLDPFYEKDIESEFADLKNMGRTGEAGAIYAAQFLARFIDGKPWAHLDVAGMTWASEQTAMSQNGGTGFGVRLLEEYIAVTG